MEHDKHVRILRFAIFPLKLKISDRLTLLFALELFKNFDIYVAKIEANSTLIRRHRDF